MDSTTLKCLPVYIMIDTSYSMSEFENVLNESIEELYDLLITSPRVSDFAQVSIISYNTEAEVVLGMTELQTLTQLPQLSCGGTTIFEKAIRLLRQRIDEDVPMLQAAGRAVHRPVAFLLTDGCPTDTRGAASDAWMPEYDALVAESYLRHPNVVPFGYGSATIDIVRRISTIPGAAYLAEDGDRADALKNVIPALLNTLIVSAQNDELSIPKEIDGFIRVSKDFMP